MIDETMGRRITMDPIRTLPVTLEVSEVESTLGAGLRVQWVTAQIPDHGELEICVGAGVGSPWGSIDYDGKQYVFNVRSLISGFLDAVSALAAETSEEVS